MKLSPAQQSVIDALKNNQRLTCVEHTAVGLFAGKLYNASLSSFKSSVHTATLKSLVTKGILIEKSRKVWQESEGQWTMYKLEYELDEEV